MQGTNTVELRRYKKDIDYYESHRAELLERYPEQWVAIFNEEVVGASPDVEQLLTELHAKGIPVGRVFIEHVTSKDDLLILPG